MIIQDVLALLPELIIFLGAMVLLMLTVFVKHGALRAVTITTIAILFVALIATIFGEPSKIPLLYNQIANDGFARLSKLIVLSISILLAISNHDFLKKDGVDAPEYSVLILLSILGMMVMVSATSFLSLFMGLELQSLSLYVMTAIRRDDKKCSEAGVKYFLLGSIKSLFKIRFDHCL